MGWRKLSMNNIKEYKLNELYRMDSGIGTTKEQANHGAPFISFSDIYNNEILPEELTEKMDTTKDEQEKYSVKKGDILITRTSETLDELAMSSVALKDYPNATFSGFAKRLRPIQTNITYDKFMAFYMRSEYFRKIINSKAVMTLRASFNDAIFSYIRILLPNYVEQVKIGDLFYEIEKKIRLNLKINRELEETAREIYNYWFLQYEFLHNTNKHYIYNNETKRNIPDEWSIKKISEIVELVSGYAFSTAEYDEKGKYKLYTIKNVQDGNILTNVDNKIKNIPNSMPTKCNLVPNDIIMSLTGNVGRVGIVYENNALLNQRVLKLIPKNNHIAYIYLLFRDTYMKNMMERISTGTSQKNLSPVDVGNLKIPVPDENTLNNFDELCNGMIYKIVKNLEEIEELKKTRNYLLPLLMNGQAKIKN